MGSMGEAGVGVRVGKPVGGALTVPGAVHPSCEMMAEKQPLTLSIGKTSATFTEWVGRTEVR